MNRTITIVFSLNRVVKKQGTQKIINEKIMENEKKTKRNYRKKNNLFCLRKLSKPRLNTQLKRIIKGGIIFKYEIYI